MEKSRSRSSNRAQDERKHACHRMLVQDALNVEHGVTPNERASNAARPLNL